MGCHISSKKKYYREEMLNFYAKNIGHTRRSERTPIPAKVTNEQLIKDMLNFIEDVDIDHTDVGIDPLLVEKRCLLMGPSSVLKSHEKVFTKAHCKQKSRTSGKCNSKRKNKKECVANRNCAWQRAVKIKEYKECLVQGKKKARRKPAVGQVERICPICLTTELNYENRWGCQCGHAICRKCFIDHVENFGFKCPTCNNYCDNDGYCRNTLMHDEVIKGVVVPIECPICKTECTECYALDVRE